MDGGRSYARGPHGHAASWHEPRWNPAPPNPLRRVQSQTTHDYLQSPPWTRSARKLVQSWQDLGDDDDKPTIAPHAHGLLDEARWAAALGPRPLPCPR